MQRVRYTKRSVIVSGKIAGIEVIFPKDKPCIMTEEKIGFNIFCANNRAGVLLLNFFHQIREIEVNKKENQLDDLKNNLEDLKEMFYSMGYDEYRVYEPSPARDRDIKPKIEELFKKAID